VHVSPSLHGVPVLAVAVHDDVPLQVRVLHVSEAHVIDVPVQTPLPLQVSL